MSPFRSQTIIDRSQGKNSGRNRGRTLLPGLIIYSCLTSFIIRLSTDCAGNGAAHSGLDSPVSISNQDCPTNMPTGQFDLNESFPPR